MPEPFILNPPKTQALLCSTFQVPPLDRSLPEIYDWHYENTPNHTVFIYSDDTSQPPKVIKWPQVVRAVHRAGAILQSRFEVKGDGSPEGTPVVAILAASGQFILCYIVISLKRGS